MAPLPLSWTVSTSTTLIAASSAPSTFTVGVIMLLAVMALLLVYLFYPALTSAYEARLSSSSSSAASRRREGGGAVGINKRGPASSLSRHEATLVRVSKHGRAGDRRTEGHDGAASKSTSSPTDAHSYPTPLLSVIVPAYNEEVRLPQMLEPALAYLSNPRCQALRNLQEHLNYDNDEISDGIGQAKAVGGDRSAASAASVSEEMVVVEWIVVSDGSTDGTERVYREFCERLPPDGDVGGGAADTGRSASPAAGFVVMLWKFLELPINRGKGMAVKAGVLASTGYYCLMVDADGATLFEDLSKLTGALLLRGRDLSQPPDSPPSTSSSITVWGSRAHLQDVPDKRRQRSLPRQLLMMAFHGFVKLICIRPNSPHVRDTQCGFKLFPRRHALVLFSNLHLRGWAFDIELLILSSFLGIGIEEVDVNWREVDGSKLSTSALNVILVSVSMLRDMICVRLCYELGLWKIRGYDDVSDGIKIVVGSKVGSDVDYADADYVRVPKSNALPDATSLTATSSNAAVSASQRTKSE